MSERAQKIIRDIPTELKDALMRQAEDEGTNLNDVAMSIVADAYDLRFTPTGKGTPGFTDSATIGLMMPRRTRKKLKAIAVSRDTTSTDLILDALLAHFDLSMAA